MTIRGRRAARELREYLLRLFGPEATISVDPMPARTQHPDRVELEGTIARPPALPPDHDKRTHRRGTAEGITLAVEIAERYVAIRSARYALPSGLVPTTCALVSDGLELDFASLFPPGTLEIDVPWLEVARATAETLAGHDVLGGVVSTQVKQKFAELRWYTQSMPEATEVEASTILDAASYFSTVVCEMCGSPGSYRKGSWVRILCDVCHATKRRKL